ncbi:MAG: hypothetical protein ACREBU_22180 [Nitrososphaera sp.]
MIEVIRREKNYLRVNPLLKQSRSANFDYSQKGKSKNQAVHQQPDQQAQATMNFDDNQFQSNFTDEAFPAIFAVIDEPPVAPVIKEAVEEAAKEVKKEIINGGGKRPTAYHYCEAVMRLLAAWKIEAPRQIVGDVVLQRWQSWF